MEKEDDADSSGAECTVIVENVPQDMDMEEFELHFESLKYSGGGPIENIDRSNSTVKIVYTEKTAASRVIARQQEVNDIRLHVKGKNEEKVTASILVSYTGSLTDKKLDMFFSNPSKSGGGEIEMQKRLSQNEVVIKYKDPAVANSVLNKCPLELQKIQLHVRPYHKQPSDVWDSVTSHERGTRTHFLPSSYIQDTASVMVNNLPCGTSDDSICVFLESQRHTGGTTVKSLSIRGRKATVEFAGTADAQKVVALKTCQFIDNAKTEICFSWPRQLDGRKLGVRGYKRSTSEELLQLLLENKSKGDIEDMQFDRNRSRAFVTFKELKAAQRILKEENITCEGASLHVSLYDEDETEQDEYEDYDQTTNTIHVSGIKDDVGKELLKYFFENERKSGGGPTERIEYDKEKATALIVYEAYKDAASVLAHGNLTLSGNRIRVVGVENTNPMMGEESCAVVVKNVSSDDVNMVVNTLEGRRSAGEKAVQHFYDEDTSKLIVTFKSSEAVIKILLQPIEDRHGQNLDLDVMLPSESSFIVTPPLETNKIIVRGLTKNVKAHDLKAFIQQGANRSVAELVYGIQPDIAMCVFLDVPDLKSLKALCQSKPLCDSMLVIQRLSQTDTIQVYPIGGMTDVLSRTLPLYFDSARSGGGIIKDSQPLDSGILIQFEEPQTVEHVLSKCPHKIGVTQLHVAAYYDFLGELPPGLDTSSPAAWMQSCMDITDANEKIVGYLINKSEHQRECDTVMLRNDTEIDWPLQPHGSIQLKCTLKYTDPMFAQKSQVWARKSREAFDQCMAKLDYARVDTLQEIWQQVTEELKGQEKAHPSLLIVMDSKATCINITGPKPEVLTFSKKANETKRKHEEDLKRRKTKITEKLTKFKQWQLELFETLDIRKSVLDLFSQLKMEIKTIDKLVILEGTPDEISKVKVKLYSEASRYQTKTYDLSKPMVGFFGTLPVLQELKATVKMKGFKVAVQIQGSQIQIHAGSHEDAVRAISFVKHYACEESIDVDDKATQAMKTDRWRNCKDALIKKEGKNKLRIQLEGKKVVVCCLTERKDSIVLEMCAFTEQNTLSSMLLPFKCGEIRLIECYHKHKLFDIEKKHAEWQLKAKPLLEGRNCGLLLECCRSAMQEVSFDIVVLMSSCICKEHPVSSPGIAQYFVDESGQNVLRGFETKCKVAIEIKEAHRMHSDKPHTISKKFAIPGGGELAVVHGDLTLCDVDAIVNAANDRMDHGAGVAFAIVKRGGQSIQAECTDFINSQGPLKKGQVYVSSAGNLLCKKVIHTVGPTWKGGSHNEEKDLHEAVVKALEAAKRHQFTSVAMPPISSGIFGFPLDKCVRTIHRAICDTATSLNIKQIQIVSNDEKHLQVFCDVIEGKWIKETATEKVGSSDAVHGIMEAAGVDERKIGDLDAKHGTVPLDISGGTGSLFKAASEGNALVTGEGMTIKIIKGTITKQKVDVIVNTTGHDMDFSTGAVSSSILAAAGSGIQDEARRAAPTGIAGGQIVQTSPGSLQCKQIYHGYCTGYKTLTCEKDLKTLMTTSLATANQQKHITIAFPAIGTGQLHIPPDISANWMFNAATEFSKNNPSASIKTVCFVVYEKDDNVMQAFEKELKLLTSSTGYGYSSCHIPYAIQTSEGITVQTVKGKLEEQQVDVVVNTTTKDLQLHAGTLSSSILKAVGSSIQDDCNRIAPNGLAEPGQVVKTSSGQLRTCKAIYHTNCPPYQDKTCQQKFLKLMNNCLQQADQSGMTSIAFPAIGTGQYLKIPAAISAKWMYDAVTTYSKANPRTGIKKVIIAMLHDDKLKGFDDCRKLQISSRTTAGPVKTKDNEVIRQIGGVTVVVRSGDICAESTDVIVNGTNSSLDLTGAVSKSIVKRGGETIIHECKDIGKTNRHGIAVTWAGLQLKCTYIIHADVRQTDALEKRVMNCLYTAEQHNIQSIAFPALGTGGGSNPETAASHLLGGIKKYINEKKPKSLQLIHVTVFQQSLVPVYMNAMSMDPEWGFMKAAKTIVTKVAKPVAAEEPQRAKATKDRKLITAKRTEPLMKMLEKPDAELTFQIFGFTDHSINQTVEMLKKHCKQVTKIKAIDDPKVVEVIDNLNEQQIAKIHALENVYQVCIKIVRSVGISIEGTELHLSDVVTEIHRILRDADTKADADLIAKQVQWQYCKVIKGPRRFRDYPPEINRVIEQASLRDQNYAEWEEDKNNMTVKMRIHFTDLSEYIAITTTKTADVRRQSVLATAGEGFALPNTWTDNADDKVYTEVLQKDNPEYETVNAKFQASVGATRQIIKIERIQNKRLFQQYKAQKAFLDNQNPKGHQNERELWHGTSADTIEKININGFNRSFCGKNATRYGDGVYFAVAASYSAGGYSAPDAHGHKHMYLTKVLTGEYTTGSAGLRAAPAKSGEIRYDSVTNSPTNPTMFVIFHDAAAYPEYLVKFI